MTQDIRLQRLPSGEFGFSRDGEVIPVRTRRCFPWSEPTRFVTLRDGEDKELVLIEDLNALEPDSRAMIHEALAEADFVLEVESVLSVETEIDIRVWRVRTRQGECQFQTKMDDFPEVMPEGGLLFRDVVGNLFRVPATESLDERSRKLLWAYID